MKLSNILVYKHNKELYIEIYYKKSLLIGSLLDKENRFVCHDPVIRLIDLSKSLGSSDMKMCVHFVRLIRIKADPLIFQYLTRLTKLNFNHCSI